MPKTKVYIGRLPRELQQADLEDEFKKYGKFVRVDLRSGYGFIVSFDIFSILIFFPGFRRFQGC